MEGHLHCAEQQESPSNITKYCACYEKWDSKSKELSWKRHKRHLHCAEQRKHRPISPNIAPPTKHDTPKYQRNFWKMAGTSFSVSGATGATVQDHQIIAPATKNDAPKYQRNVCETAETSFTVRGATGVTVQDHQILAPATKNDAPKYQRNFWETAETSFTLRGATGATVQDHQTIATAAKNDVPKYQRHFLGKRLKTYIARSNRSHPPTLPNIAPATKNYIPK